ncbi:MAG TPA: ATP-binding protein [Smithellaceae bacterium]|nr:ATP-binding protein [Smithellaceae bacterium]HOF78542.1 ATP-binding protein [Smithellaceae bacterium]HOM68815.1 ATP-binding protein [Smithellaceae bacterium]HOS10051.1 ATP-binding protein [Smithellaceae bacterium]HOU05082.1 ATP-binding protein [Smithellaceae bacterium]
MVKKSKKNYLDDKEIRKRRRERIIMVVVGFLAITFTVIASHVFNKEGLPISANIFVYGLSSINVILILLLLFLIVRNIVKLFYEHRRGIIGSRLRTKLVAAFVGLSLVPTILLFLFAINFLSYNLEFWFNVKTGEALNKSLEVAQIYYQQAAEQAKFNARQISADITRNRLYQHDRLEYLKSFIIQRQKNYNLGMVEAHFDFQPNNMMFPDAEHPELNFPLLTPKMLEDLYSGKEIFTVESTNVGEIVVGVAPVFSYAVPSEVIGRVSVGYNIPQGLVEKLRNIADASQQYGQINILKNPIKFNYLVTMSIVTLVIIFLATWFGLTLAGNITGPIQNLAEATNKITRGDLDIQIDVEADDEIGLLVKSFNKMTKDLKKSSGGLVQANIILEERRKYIETILRNVSAGIISLDKNGVITTINNAAEKMFDLNPEDVLNKNFRDLMIPEHLTLVDEFIKEIEESNKEALQKQLELMLKDRALTVLLTVTTIKDESGNDTGMVVMFEDMTQLQRAERAAAWREVARRMAHEIKNPLTPIQLSAQRLQKKYSEKLEDGSVFKECTQIIIDQVEVLKNLVNEFSRYARMPVTTPAPNDLNEVIADSVSLFQDAHKDITFEFKKAENMPKFEFDAEQMNRVLINLLDNAVAAINDNKGGKIEITAGYDEQSRRATVAVADDGSGVPANYKGKVFDPYFSTKKSGTGLGLAIVNSIISDHHGQVSVSDNFPTGTVVSFQLPVSGV